MNILLSFCGVYAVKLVCADPARMLDGIHRCGIRLYQIKLEEEFCVSFLISRGDYAKLTQYATGRGIVLEQTGRRGIYWPIKGVFERKLLVVTVMLMLILTLWLPTRILFIRVEGNNLVPSRQIREAASNSGVCFGAARRNIRSEKVKNHLLTAIPELQWAGVNTSGSQAVITVRERPDQRILETQPQISSIVAARDALVLSATVTDGTCLCTPGQTVRAGEVLISAFTDCGRTISATRAEGEVFAQTKHTLEAITPVKRNRRREFGEVKKNYSLQIGKKRINFYKGSGIYGGSCVKMYSKYVLTLPGGLELPVAWVCETIQACTLTEETLDVRLVKTQLQACVQRYLLGCMVAGSILEKDEVISNDKGNFLLTGSYVCREMIGRVREEILGDYHGKDNGTDRECGSGG